MFAIADRPSEFTRLHTNRSLHAAAAALAGVCDYAHSDDRQGYNSLDALFGHRVAQFLPPEVWSDDLATEVHRMLRKYAGQLSGFGIVYADLPTPSIVSEDTAALRTARDEARAAERAAKRSILVHLAADGSFLVKGPGTFDVKDTIKSFGARWDGDAKAWSFDATDAANVLALVQSVDWLGIHDSAEPSLAGVEAADPAEVKKAKVTKGAVVKGRRVALAWKGVSEEEFDALLRDVKDLPGREYLSSKKVNVADLCRETLAFCRKHDFVGADDVESALIEYEEQEKERLIRETAAEAASHAATNTREVALAQHLYEYQKAGVEYVLDHADGRAIIGDEMGLGKTRQAIAAIEDREAFPAVFVVPPHLTANWVKEFRAVAPHRDIRVLKGTKPNPDLVEGADVLVIGYSVLKPWVEFRVGDPETGEVLLKPKAVVFDESHFAKNHSSQRTKAALALAGRVREGGIRLCLTGTPVLNRVDEILSQIELIGRWTDFGSKAEFLREYGKAGTAKLQQLNARLRRNCYVRRLKKDVLADLPSKIRHNAYVEIEDHKIRAEYSVALRDIVSYLIETKGAEKASIAAKAAALVRLNTLRQIAGRAKVVGATEWINEFLRETERSLVVFASHVPVQDAIYASLVEAGVPVARIHGSDSDTKVEAEKARFQNGDARVIICSLKKGGTGHTLTAASDVLIVEQDWTPANLTQAEDRVHRIGQEAESVTATHLVCDLSIDQHLRTVVEGKQVICDAVAQGGEGDDVLDTTVIDEVINLLLSDEDSTGSASGAA